jgi:hypothetical protein
MQIKPKQKRNSNLKPKEQEVFGRVLCNIEIMQDLYEELKDINESLIDDLCCATDKIEFLEERVKEYKSCYEESEEFNYELMENKYEMSERIESLEKGFIKGIIVATLIIGSLWILSLI